MIQLVAQERMNRTVASQIYALRTHHGLTQQQLASRIGTTQSVIARLEDADYDGHSLKMLSRIAAALGCTVSVTFVPMQPKAAKRRRQVAALHRSGTP
jgi:transcriptional regulator with XRE-family HTH domain